MEVLQAILSLGAAFFVLRWLFTDSSSKAKRPLRRRKATSTLSSKKAEIEMKDIGSMAGMMGGEMEDAFIGKYTLERTEVVKRERRE